MPDGDDGPAEGYVEPADDGEGYVAADPEGFRFSISGPGVVANLTGMPSQCYPRVAAATSPGAGQTDDVALHLLSNETGADGASGWSLVPMDPESARRLASQLLTAADYADDGDYFNPETMTSEIHFSEEGDDG